MVKKQNVALVLSGGSARGLAHIGVIEELEAQNYEISSIAATSMGALIGAMYVAGTLNDFKSWITKLRKKDLLKLVDPSFRSNGLIKGKKLFTVLHKFIPNCNIQDLKKPLRIVVTDITNKKEVVLEKGSLRDALRATIAIPTIFTPLEKDGVLLVDGGASNNTPVDRIKRKKGDILVVVDVNADITVAKEFLKKSNYVLKTKKNTVSKSKFHILGDTLHYMIHNTSKEALDTASIDINIPISYTIASLYAFYKAKLIIEYGRYQTKKALS